MLIDEEAETHLYGPRQVSIPPIFLIHLILISNPWYGTINIPIL